MRLLWWRHPNGGGRRILVPFTRGLLDETVLDAAIRITRAEEATLVPAYLILIPMQFPLEATMRQEVELGIPLLEAVEHAASKAGVLVDARIESGRTPIHALRRLWEAEHFDRIVVPAPIGREPGFAADELLWMLTHAPSETLVLRPDPALCEPQGPPENGRIRVSPSLPQAGRNARRGSRAAGRGSGVAATHGTVLRSEMFEQREEQWQRSKTS